MRGPSAKSIMKTQGDIQKNPNLKLKSRQRRKEMALQTDPDLHLTAQTIAESHLLVLKVQTAPLKWLQTKCDAKSLAGKRMMARLIIHRSLLAALMAVDRPLLE